MAYLERVAIVILLAASGMTRAAEKSPGVMQPLLESFAADRRDLQRFYNIEQSAARRERLERFYRDWLGRLPQLDFDAMKQDDKIDYIVFRHALEHDIQAIKIRAKEDADAGPLIPFASVIMHLEVSRQQMQPLDPRLAAETLSKLARSIEDTRKSLEAELKSSISPEAARLRKIHAARAVAIASGLRTILRSWFTFYDGYDPQFTWWAAADYKNADHALEAYIAFLNERILGLRPAVPAAGPNEQTRGAGRGGSTGTESTAARAGDTKDIIGSPIGRAALLSELAYEMIPYTPEELIAIANKEFAWCENEMKRASREMGYGDDWKKALEKVKNMYVEPGKQPQLIRELALEAIQFTDDHDLVTIPPVARETWRMQMMSPERQLVNPFFTGGETISVSYPTDSMSYENKLMSMRGNNRPFSKATVFHELIPGHELQGYMSQRFRPYRGAAFGRSAFVTEGWSLYWELLLWDMKFQKTPEERVGALFWHMHRCARIIFSLSFHLNKMTPDECIQFLVDRVGFERENAIGEVRRSFATNYGPLYQAAYLLGGRQFYALHKELVDSGKMTNRQFHDAILKENYIPVEMMRADLMNLPLTRDYKSNWKFADAAQ
ncbi:MAG TPA: DUF885 family protein [Bryobacteraceae bacterium]